MNAFSLTLIVLGLASATSDEAEIGELPFCDPKQAVRELVIVSTLDGKLSVLEANGELRWSMQTEPGPLLTSSIDRLELTSSGRWVRMIPSLSGGFYKFDGETIEAIPVSASSLLHSSNFLSTDGLVVSGGQESRSYGLSLDSGAVRFSCAMGGCENASAAASALDREVLLVQRRSHTVRAVEVRTGGERWNFSVGQLEVKLVSEQCHPDASPTATALRISAVVPDGMVCAETAGSVLWRHKLSAPIVSAWHVRGGVISAVELFALGAGRGGPGLYLGMHRKQLYVQESAALAAMARARLAAPDSAALALPWRPVRARREQQPGLLPAEDAAKATALSVLYASEYANGDGFYLFLSPTCGANHSGGEDMLGHEGHWLLDDEEETPTQVIMGSLWLWWREVAAISLATAALVHLLLGRGHTPVPPPAASAPRPQTPPTEAAPPASRYAQDFQQVAVLGRGGFGVVFEAVNRVDARAYAVKRVSLTPGHRESVLREVRALASLEHPHIVRYFNAWLEAPPPAALRHRGGEGDAVINMSSQDASESGSQTPSSGVGSFGSKPQHTNPRGSDFIQFKESTNPSESDFIQFREPTNPSGSDFIQFREPTNPSGSDSIQFRESTNPRSSDCRQFRLSRAGSEFVDFRDPPAGSRSDFLVVGGGENALVSGFDSSAMSDSTTNARSSTGHTEVEASEDEPRDGHGGGRVPRGTVFLYIQMQLCRKESLREWLREATDRSQALPMFAQILEAVEYVHAQALIHRDLKPSNIFFSPDGRVKVGDFGLVTAAPLPGDGNAAGNGARRHTGGAGTQLYMSPEQRAGLPYSYKVDIFSLGIILFELLVPFATQMERGVAIGNARRGRFPTGFVSAHASAHALLLTMLAARPEERPSAADIRSQPPISQVSQ